MNNGTDKHGADGLAGLSPQIAPRWMVQDEIGWRRHQVMEYLASGYSQIEISKKMSKGTATISRDVQFLREKAKNEYKSLVVEKIPFEVQRTLALFENIKKQGLQLAENSDRDSVKVSALALVLSAGEKGIQLQQGGEFVARALRLARGMKDSLESLEEEKAADEEDKEKDDDDGGEEVDLTNDENAVFR